MNELSRLSVLVALAATFASGCWDMHGRDARVLTDAGPGLDATARDAAPFLLPDAATAACPSPLERFFEPGCGAPDVPIEPGCYQPCDGPDDASCGTGRTCRRTDINPCPCAPGSDCCGACGAEQWLCLDPPTPTACAGRTYCDCVDDGCVPLIDRTHGCVCPCDEPFRCGGPPCDCDCGGAQYLGCAAPDACMITEVTCGSDSLGGLVDGCPECVGGI